MVKKNVPVRVVLRKKDITFEETVLCDFEKETLSFEAFRDVETVFHVAGCTHETNSKRNIDIYRKINTESTAKIAEIDFCCIFSMKIHVIFTKMHPGFIRVQCLLILFR